MMSKCLASRFVSSLKLCSKAAFNGIRIGDILRETRVFTNSDVVEYSKVSHDTNPVHFDAQCARSAGFEDRLVHGMLVASLFPRIIAAHFPGAVYVSQNLQFKRPVYVEEEIVGEVQAVSVKELKKKCLVKFSTKCLKNDLVVLDGEAMAILPVLTTDEPESNKD